MLQHIGTGEPGQEPTAAPLDVSGLVRRVRRRADLSQRELGAAVGLDQSQIARIESDRRRVDLATLGAILAVAGLRLAIVDADGKEVHPAAADSLRDNADRRVPAHLDIRSQQAHSLGRLRAGHSGRPEPRVSYLRRPERDRLRRRSGSSPIAVAGGGPPDQPTRRDLERLEGTRLAARLERARERFMASFGEACSCVPECFRHEVCPRECSCHCGE